jgi:hypothetical protein
MKLSSCYLEHLDSLGLRYANRLKSWVGGFRTKDSRIQAKSDSPSVNVFGISFLRTDMI